MTLRRLLKSIPILFLFPRPLAPLPSSLFPSPSSPLPHLFLGPPTFTTTSTTVSANLFATLLLCPWLSLRLVFAPAWECRKVRLLNSPRWGRGGNERGRAGGGGGGKCCWRRGSLCPGKQKEGAARSLKLLLSEADAGDGSHRHGQFDKCARRSPWQPWKTSAASLSPPLTHSVSVSAPPRPPAAHAPIIFLSRAALQKGAFVSATSRGSRPGGSPPPHYPPTPQGRRWAHAHSRVSLIGGVC